MKDESTLWMHVQALFYSESSIAMEDLGVVVEPEYTDYSFRLDRVESFNVSSTDGHTCIRLMSGFDITIDVDYAEFFKIMININQQENE